MVDTSRSSWRSRHRRPPMPWNEISTMSLRLEFVSLAVAEGANIRELCRRLEVSPQAAYKWIGRYRRGGRRPGRSSSAAGQFPGPLRGRRRGRGPAAPRRASRLGGPQAQGLAPGRRRPGGPLGRHDHRDPPPQRPARCRARGRAVEVGRPSAARRWRCARPTKTAGSASTSGRIRSPNLTCDRSIKSP